MQQTSSDADSCVEKWKARTLLKCLKQSKGNGTSLITLIIPPKDQIPRVAKMLGEELGTAANIKSKVTKVSVLGAITSTQQKLKLYARVPDNGLAIFCGTVITTEGKEKKVTFDLVPFKPINTSLYLCDNAFHTEALDALLGSDPAYGFVIVDGNGCLFGTLSGTSKQVLHRLCVDLPKKHGRGGQSAARFARLREEKRHNYIRKVAELAVQMFITNDKPNVSGIIIAGSAGLKHDLEKSDMFDPRLKNVVLALLDICYGGENGFNQAIDLSAGLLVGVKYIHEKQLLTAFFDEISRDTDKFRFGVNETLDALMTGAVDTLIAWEDLDIMRYSILDDLATETPRYLYCTKEQRDDPKHMLDHNGTPYNVVDALPLLDWLASNYRQYGVVLEIVSDKTQEGSQFCKGFGGFGAILRYKVENTYDLDHPQSGDEGIEDTCADDL